MTSHCDRRKLFLASLVSACAVLLICSKSSPLYPMNDWVDVNCFFTVGRGIKHGLVPYLDLYEQKGPLLYFLYYVAALISEDSYLGVFLVELLCFACFLYEGGRIAALWAGERRATFALLPVLALGIGVSKAFSHGSSAEELFLPVLALSLRIVLEGIKKNEPFSKRQLFVLGLCAGAALWFKYTFCGFFLGLFVAVLIWYLVRCWWRKLPLALLFAALGAVGLSLLVLGWFALRGGLRALVEAYFTNNLSAYASSRGNRYDPPPVAILKNWPWSLPAALGILYLLLHAKKDGWALLTVSCAALALYVTTYINGRSYPYYALILSVFAPLGLIPVLRLLARLPDSSSRQRWLVWPAAALSLACAVWLAYSNSSNAYLLGTAKADMPQYRFAAIIAQAEDKSLLNEGFLDGGFYFAAETDPVNRYFCTFNMRLSEMEQEHSRMIREGETAFVVTRNQRLDSRSYQLVDQCSFPFEGRNWTYYLYQRKE